jgi:hypothetical protein
MNADIGNQRSAAGERRSARCPTCRNTDFPVGGPSDLPPCSDTPSGSQVGKPAIRQIGKSALLTAARRGFAVLWLLSPVLVGAADYTLDWDVVATGGGASGDGKYLLGDTAGQPVVGVSAGGNYVLEDGFWPGMGQFGSTRVVLYDFQVGTRAGQVVVRWQTASEVSTLGFQLYRQTGPAVWTPVGGFIASQGQMQGGVGAAYEVVDAGGFVPVATDLAATPPLNSFTGRVDAASAFFRIMVQ